MKQYARTLFRALILTAASLAVTACQQAPAPVAAAPAEPAAATPAPQPPEVIVEHGPPRDRRDDRPRASVDVDIHKQQNHGDTSVDLHAHP